MRFYIIDDRENDHTFITAAVKTAFPQATFALREGSTFAKWGEVADYLRRSRDEIAQDESIMLLDMSLGDGDAEAQVDEGIRRARALRMEFPAAILIACTQYDRSVAAKVQAAENPFHGIFAKESWRALPDAERPIYVRTIVETARPRTQSLIGALTDRTKIDDSLGVRSFCAAFGDGAIDELVIRFADASDTVRIRALTGGLSGAFLFEIKTEGAGGRRSRIVKLARDRGLIDNEVRGLTTLLPEFGQLATVLLPPIGEIKNLLCGAFYLEQIAVDGEDLLRFVRRDPVNGLPVIRRYISLLATCVAQAIASPSSVRLKPLGKLFGFTLLDLARLRVSAEFLSGFGAALARKGLWPEARTPTDVATSLSELAAGWRRNDLSFLRREVPVSAQHGDAHLANVLLTSTGELRLVDLARVGIWPVGYDIGRAAVQARLRLTECDNYVDFFPERLPGWFAGSDGPVDAAALGDEFLAAFAKTIDGSPHEEALAFAVNVGMVWDLLKIASYGDISPQKRVWSMLLALRLGAPLMGDEIR